jgi:hypothetical protein
LGDYVGEVVNTFGALFWNNADGKKTILATGVTSFDNCTVS